VQIGSSLVNSLRGCRVLEVAQPRTAIAKILAFIRAEYRQLPWVAERRIAPGATISPLAVLEGDVDIGDAALVEPFCTIGPDVVLGEGSIERAGARILPHVRIGQKCVIGPNAVIGSEGYGFVRDEADNKLRIPHLGGVIIGFHVEIGAVSVIQGGTISPTTIEDYAKIDDHVQIGHNARIGQNVSLIGGVAIGGSAVIEDEAWIGINASIRNARRVGMRALVGMDASVQTDLPDNAVVRAPRPEITPRACDEIDKTSIGFTERSHPEP